MQPPQPLTLRRNTGSHNWALIMWPTRLEEAGVPGNEALQVVLAVKKSGAQLQRLVGAVS
jgi:hypothetical protein